MPTLFDNTICAPATARGGAIAVIRVSGKNAIGCVDRIFSGRTPLSEAAGYTMHFGSIREDDGSLLDEVVVSVFRAPHSYTGENAAEIACHGSDYIVSRILALLLENGAKMAAPGEFTQRAFVGGKMDLSQAEAVADLIAAQTSAAHRVALNQLKGGFSEELAGMCAELLHLASLLELELDFGEEEVEFADRSQLRGLVEKVLGHCEKLIESFRLGNAIKNGVPVAIVGNTNAGKSTLLNALLGENRAIVTDIPGTTRDAIEDTCNLDGVLFRFIDTAGLRESDDPVERIGIDRAYEKLSAAQLVLAVLDLSSPLPELTASAQAIAALTAPEQQL
ncbi:MAG: tRNA uridine-5-carboxymethylaminomethyl(34) synthesis GTPase MnmE, partial [Bacteroidales bacterium]|nr:tRNA uridine-5-carboxymethylaminomethyl(34) synthesis GTPase MnmE [Bacteroidales bacterium]